MRVSCTMHIKFEPFFVVASNLIQVPWPHEVETSRKSNRRRLGDSSGGGLVEEERFGCTLHNLNFLAVWIDDFCGASIRLVNSRIITYPGLTSTSPHPSLYG